ncbi:mRNA splicing protein PRP45 [Saccharomyces paradoxus]|uniref:Pre-mRNA-processing protein 45 n=1 Tax=Saccharomyces paradoxus TaxID=27291 RepID=A0A8B8ULC8_SACPA|nr:Prp45 [Saccharomyces paradoxus]QHS71409.1 Prp45 [Saccharomyces paradoxus]
MFSSRLPPPKHSQAQVSTTSSSDRVEPAILTDQIAKNVKLDDFIPKRQSNFELSVPLPTQADIQECSTRTKSYIQRLVNAKLSNSNNRASSRYVTETHQAPTNLILNNSRHIEVVSKQMDPLLPRFVGKKARKVVAPTENDEVVPVLHTDGSNDKEEADPNDWKIPAAVSNWKNPNGYTVALERRVGKAPDNENAINDGFMKLSKALENADKKARQEIKYKMELKRLAMEQETLAKESKLKELSQRARYHNGTPQTGAVVKPKKQTSTVARLKELAYSQGRDVSEKVILGAAKRSEQPDLQYDSRFFTRGANASAKRHEDQVYDNPLFVQQDIESIYKTNYEQLDQAVNVKSEGSSGSHGPIQFTKAESDDKSDNFGAQAQDEQ